MPSTFSRTAFLRLATPADLHDAVLLALSGVDLAFEPVPGFLTGLGEPLPVERRPKCFRLSVDREPKSVAAAVLALATFKGLSTSAIDVEATDPGLHDVIVGVVRCLSQRAGRPLDRTDIVDLMGWISALTPSRIDAQVPYGCPEWGAILRREADATHLGRHASPDSTVTRTIVCYVQPTADDLSRILDAAPVGLINAQGLKGRAPWSCGLSACGRLYLASHCLAPVVRWIPDDGGIRAPELTREILFEAGTPDAAYRALYGSSWAEGRRQSRIAYEAAAEPLPSDLQAVWTHQRDGLRVYGVDVVAMPPCRPDDLRRHMLDEGYKAAADAKMPRPSAVTCTTVTTAAEPIETLRVQTYWNGSLCTHHAAADVAFSPDDNAALVEYLGDAWDGFVAARFRPS